MLTDTKLRNLKSKDKPYKVNERDGLYVAVTTAGSISFCYNYLINIRQETITFGRYGVGGLTLSEARAKARTKGEGVVPKMAARSSNGRFYPEYASLSLCARTWENIWKSKVHRNSP